MKNKIEMNKLKYELLTGGLFMGGLGIGMLLPNTNVNTTFGIIVFIIGFILIISSKFVKK